MHRRGTNREYKRHFHVPTPAAPSPEDQPEQAEKVLARVIPAAENPTALSHIHHAQLHIGATFGLLGRKADAVRWVTKAADEGYPSFLRFSTDQSLAPLRGYPPYEALMVRLRNDWNRWRNTL